MATEIELKAHVQESETLKALLFLKAEYTSAFEKEDTYWFFAPGPGTPAVSRVRLRRERQSFPDGKVLSATLATCKAKERRDGIEVNDELEFAVDPALEFERFLKTLGFKPGISKRKRGWAFSRGNITAELAEVKGLGWFIELEILTDDIREEIVAESKERLLGFLDDLGVDRGDIEHRYYTEMLTPALSDT